MHGAAICAGEFIFSLRVNTDPSIQVVIRAHARNPGHVEGCVSINLEPMRASHTHFGVQSHTQPGYPGFPLPCANDRGQTINGQLHAGVAPWLCMSCLEIRCGRWLAWQRSESYYSNLTGHCEGVGIGRLCNGGAVFDDSYYKVCCFLSRHSG